MMDPGNFEAINTEMVRRKRAKEKGGPIVRVYPRSDQVLASGWDAAAGVGEGRRGGNPDLAG